jgi:hypothetical protein
MKLQIYEPITELHFKGTFYFPDDNYFLTRQSEHQCFVNLFNEMIEKRLSNQYIAMNPNFKVTTNYSKPIDENTEKVIDELSKYFKK